ncbi:site-specific integrase [Pseudalkalibacillus caeni]|uniref:Site-specific integrase n=1 Tax=Exobacillus caeni TaxID=2574798 RepID=A0A5R9F2P9_9BACL|nr:site-specific integrase [Pseudalkalibacillus caeni]
MSDGTVSTVEPFKTFLTTTHEKLGSITKHFSAHKLRHRFATLLYSSGVELLELKQLLGHNCLDMK